MELSVKVLAILNLLGAAQGALLALALLTARRGNRAANRLLAAFVATISILVIGAILFTTKYIFIFPHLSRLHHPFIYLVAPLLFLYIRALTSPGKKSDKTDLLHLIPFVLCAIYLVPYYLQSAAYKIANPGSADYESWYYTRHAILFVQGAGYLVFTVRYLATYARKVGGQSSPAERAVLLQIRALVIAVLILLAGGMVRYLLRDRSTETNLLLPLGASIMVYVVAWLALRNPEVLAGLPEPPPQPKKYERSTLTPERADEYIKRLLEVMDGEKPFTDGELTLQKLAGRLAIPAQHLSQIINERLGQSFSDFINSYRIEEAKRRLLDPARRHYSVLAIAEEVGFNSKSTFNAAFKKHTGRTPSEFRDASNFVESG
ncbi:MAG TPA: helix-turn-helix domain-containing protein [Blastocatellia bacterium]|nr:helix-turn-helix domain-containing protein [Blastocatellia bacterium]